MSKREFGVVTAKWVVAVRLKVTICVPGQKRPPGYQSKGEYGLVRAKWAVAVRLNGTLSISKKGAYTVVVRAKLILVVRLKRTIWLSS